MFCVRVKEDSTHLSCPLQIGVIKDFLIQDKDEYVCRLFWELINKSGVVLDTVQMKIRKLETTGTSDVSEKKPV